MHPDDEPTETIRAVTPRPAARSSRRSSRRARRGRPGWLAGKIALGVVSLLVLTGTGYAWSNYQDLSASLTRSDALAGEGGAHSVNGDTNILLLGLDTRLDENGNPLPQNIYDALHAGDNVSAQGEDANVLMLLHVPGNGGRATAISIPRDDMVSLAGCPDHQCTGKIKEAYGLAMEADLEATIKQGGMSKAQRFQHAREAGRRAEIDTVRQFLGGVPIDHFVEVTLIAFFQIAQVIQPITVCLKENTEDTEYSGASFHAGLNTIDASQAVAFVRQRRDPNTSLLFTDLDRERRQQAFISSVAYQLKQAGTFANPSTVAGILNVAKANIAVDSGLDLSSFAAQASNLTSGDITFYTLPVAGFSPPTGDQFNYVNVPQIQAIVRQLIPSSGATSSAPAASPTSTTTPATAAADLAGTTVDVVNASTRTGRAAQLETALVHAGFGRGTSGNPSDHQTRSTSEVYYGAGAADAAGSAARLLGGLPTAAASSVPAHTIRVVIGSDFTMPAALQTTSTTTGAPNTSAAPVTPVAADSGGAAGPGTDQLTALSAGGIPCVK